MMIPVWMTMAAEQAENAEQATVQSGGIGGTIVCAVLAMVLIYAVTANLSKIAAAVDRMLGRGADSGDSLGDREKKASRTADGYSVADIYNGERDFADKDDITSEEKE